MIAMPHRSVTRFFVPLIDVLLLLFGIFLLMPFSREHELDEEREHVGEERESVEALQYELRQRTEELEKFDKLRPALEDVDKLKSEIDRLRNANRQNLQERTVVRVIDIDPKSGELYYYDAGRRLDLADAKSARQLIERQRRELKDRELYFYFLYPRPETGYPTLGQERLYRAWFAGVPNSLQETRS